MSTIIIAPGDSRREWILEYQNNDDSDYGDISAYSFAGILKDVSTGVNTAVIAENFSVYDGPNSQVKFAPTATLTNALDDGTYRLFVISTDGSAKVSTDITPVFLKVRSV